MIGPLKIVVTCDGKNCLKRETIEVEGRWLQGHGWDPNPSTWLILQNIVEHEGRKRKGKGWKVTDSNEGLVLCGECKRKQ